MIPVEIEDRVEINQIIIGEWIMFTSPEGFVYYYNDMTGESRWASDHLSCQSGHIKDQNATFDLEISYDDERANTVHQNRSTYESAAVATMSTNFINQEKNDEIPNYVDSHVSNISSTRNLLYNDNNISDDSQESNINYRNQADVKEPYKYSRNHNENLAVDLNVPYDDNISDDSQTSDKRKYNNYDINQKERYYSNDYQNNYQYNSELYNNNNISDDSQDSRNRNHTNRNQQKNIYKIDSQSDNYNRNDISDDSQYSYDGDHHNYSKNNSNIDSFYSENDTNISSYNDSDSESGSEYATSSDDDLDNRKENGSNDTGRRSNMDLYMEEDFLDYLETPEGLAALEFENRRVAKTFALKEEKLQKEQKKLSESKKYRVIDSPNLFYSFISPMESLVSFIWNSQYFNSKKKSLRKHKDLEDGSGKRDKDTKILHNDSSSEDPKVNSSTLRARNITGQRFTKRKKKDKADSRFKINNDIFIDSDSDSDSDHHNSDSASDNSVSTEGYQSSSLSDLESVSSQDSDVQLINSPTFPDWLSRSTLRGSIDNKEKSNVLTTPSPRDSLEAHNPNPMVLINEDVSHMEEIKLVNYLSYYFLANKISPIAIIGVSWLTQHTGLRFPSILSNMWQQSILMIGEYWNSQQFVEKGNEKKAEDKVEIEEEEA